MNKSWSSQHDKLVSGVIAALVAVVLYQSITGIPSASPPSESTADSPTAALAQACAEPVKLPKPLRQVDFVTDFYGMRYHGNTRNELDLMVLYVGAWEKYLLHFLRDSVTSLAGENGVFVDVGANVGQHSLYMSKHAKHVHSFEPYERVLTVFRGMVADNAIENITIHPVGLGDKAQSLPFYEPPENNLGTGSFLRDFSEENHDAGSKLELVRGDDALAQLERLDVMKLDIEGYEKPAIVGLERTLAKHRPVVVMEVTIDPSNDQLFKSQEEILAAFPDGYELRLLERTQHGMATGAYRVLQVKIDFSMKQQQDLVLYPREKQSKLQLSAGPDSDGQ